MKTRCGVIFIITACLVLVGVGYLQGGKDLAKLIISLLGLFWGLAGIVVGLVTILANRP